MHSKQLTFAFRCAHNVSVKRLKHANNNFFSCGATNNEDEIAPTNSYGFVLDGATGLLKENIPNLPSDAQWFVQHNGLYGTIDFDQVCQVVGLTDGFSQIYDTFNIFDIPTFLNQLKTQSIEQLYNILWQAQEDDCFCNNHPRYKIRDDATIFVFNA